MFNPFLLALLVFLSLHHGSSPAVPSLPPVSSVSRFADVAQSNPGAPTTPLSVKATVADGGVTVSWLASEAGNNPVQSYIIARGTDSNNLTDLVTVDASITSYLDSDGTAGQVYQVRAVDSATPPLTSAPSDPVAATTSSPDTSSAPSPTPDMSSMTPTPTPDTSTDTSPTPSDIPIDTSSPSPTPDLTISPTPSDNATLTSPSPSTTPSPDLTPSPLTSPQTTTSPQTASPVPSASPLPVPTLAPTSPGKVSPTAIDSKPIVSALNSAVKANDVPAVRKDLTVYKQAKTTIVDNIKQLTPQKKQQAADNCRVEDQNLETALTTLSDQDQLSAYEALALCHIVEEKR